jgi:hypothetical protein
MLRHKQLRAKALRRSDVKAEFEKVGEEFALLSRSAHCRCQYPGCGVGELLRGRSPRSPQFRTSRVGEMFEMVEVHSVFVLWPVARCLLQAVDGSGYLGAKCIGRKRACFEVPEERLAQVRFRVRKYGYRVASHSGRNRCFTSAQGVARTLPARNSSRRRFTSARQASEMSSPSAFSRLSSNAIATAERSSGGSARASSKRWSTRAFISSSLALKDLLHNRSVNTDAQVRPAAARPVHLRAGYLQRYASARQPG